MKGDKIPGEHTVARYIKPKQRRLDEETGALIGIFADAFQLKGDEDSLSLTSLDFFEGSSAEKVGKVVRAIRESQQSKSLAKSSLVALSKNQRLIEICGEHSRKVRVLHDPVEGNEAHCEVRLYPRDDHELNQALAEHFFQSHEACAPHLT